MRPTTFVPPRLLLGTESLLGVSSTTRDRTLQVAARFAEPESLAVTFSKAMALGAQARALELGGLPDDDAGLAALEAAYAQAAAALKERTGG